MPRYQNTVSRFVGEVDECGQLRSEAGPTANFPACTSSENINSIFACDKTTRANQFISSVKNAQAKITHVNEIGFGIHV